MTVEVKVRLKIVLSTETFRGPDHSGPSTVSYSIEHPITLFTSGNSVLWRQNRDRSGNFDPRLPGNGGVVFEQADCVLTAEGGKQVARLSNFTVPLTSTAGGVEYWWKKPSYQPQKNSQIDWRGRGKWELLQDSSPSTEWVFLFSDWKFNTSASTALGGLFVQGSTGTLTFTDPSNVDRKFAYLGGGVGADAAQILKLIKNLKDAAMAIKIAAGIKTATKGNASTSTEDMFSRGLILKNLFRLGTRELKQEDFYGQCAWLDASIGLGRTIGGMLLFTSAPLFTALVPIVGVSKTLVQLGANGSVGWLSPG